jgi:hypothetical protein
MLAAEIRDQEDHSLRPARAKKWCGSISFNGWAWWCAPAIPATQDSTNRVLVQAGLCIKQDLILKITKKGWRVGGHGSSDRVLPSKHEALSSQKKKKIV